MIQYALKDKYSSIADLSKPMVGKKGCAAKEDAIVGGYQRRTQKGMGRTEKTVHKGAAKNPRLLKACNITR
jgi:hypothetical protein